MRRLRPSLSRHNVELSVVMDAVAIGEDLRALGRDGSAEGAPLTGAPRPYCPLACYSCRLSLVELATPGGRLVIGCPASGEVWVGRPCSQVAR